MSLNTSKNLLKFYKQFQELHKKIEKRVNFYEFSGYNLQTCANELSILIKINFILEHFKIHNSVLRLRSVKKNVHKNSTRFA